MQFIGIGPARLLVTYREPLGVVPAFSSVEFSELLSARFSDNSIIGSNFRIRRTVLTLKPEVSYADLELAYQVEVLLPQLLQLIPQPCRFFKLEVGCRIAHAFFQIRDDSLEIVAGTA